MPAIPESTRSSILLRLLDHAEHNWPQLAKVQARYHGSFAYITGVLPGGEQIPLFRLRYGGSAHSFGFAIYSPARDRYDDAVLLTGLPIGSPQEALDTACTLHLAALGHQPESGPPTNLRCHPLRYEDLVTGIPREPGSNYFPVSHTRRTAARGFCNADIIEDLIPVWPIISRSCLISEENLSHRSIYGKPGYSLPCI